MARAWSGVGAARRGANANVDARSFSAVNGTFRVGYKTSKIKGRERREEEKRERWKGGGKRGRQKKNETQIHTDGVTRNR